MTVELSESGQKWRKLDVGNNGSAGDLIVHNFFG